MRGSDRPTPAELARLRRIARAAVDVEEAEAVTPMPSQGRSRRDGLRWRCRGCDELLPSWAATVRHLDSHGGGSAELVFGGAS